MMSPPPAVLARALPPQLPSQQICRFWTCFTQQVVLSDWCLSRGVLFSRVILPCVLSSLLW